MNPLILPVKTPFGFYFYEAQRNEIISIDKEVFQYLYQTIVKNSSNVITSDECNKRISELQRFGYLLPTQVEQLNHPQTKTIEIMLERKLTMVTLQLTQRCNLRCDYCIYSENSSYNRIHSDNRMSFDTAKRIVDFYYTHTIDSEKIAIAFYGGEPTLEFDLIKKIVTYANSLFKGKEILYRMTTNATLFTDEMIEFFFDSGNDFLVLISLDGAKEIHDKHRKLPDGHGSYDVIMGNLQDIYNKNPLFLKRIHINTVIDPQSDYSAIIKILDNPLVKDIPFQFNLVEHDGEPAEYETEYLIKFNYDTFLSYLTQFREKEKVFPNKMMEYNSSYMRDKMDKFHSVDVRTVAAPGGPCEPGRMRLFVDCKGNFYPCERVSEKSECMCIGSVDRGFDIQRIKDMLNISQLTSESCKNCWAFNMCNICIKRADDNGIISATKKSRACEVSKRIAFDRIINKILIYEDLLHKKNLGKMGG